MPKIKGISIVQLRKIFSKQAPEMEKKFIARMPLELQKTYLGSVATTWTELEVQKELYGHACAVLFPDDPECFVKLGSAIAEYSYTGIYKVFLRIPDPDFVIKRWVNIWCLHHDTGKPTFERLGGKNVILTVKEYPALPLGIRQVITGHITKLMELMGYAHCQIVPRTEDPNAWSWHISW